MSMIVQLVKLIILFFVIFDPLASFVVFFTATSSMSVRRRKKTAALAILVACGISYAVLVFGEQLLDLLSTTIEDFRVAGGIVLLVLGLKMSLGQSLTGDISEQSGRAIAAIIATPLLTGPAAITAIIISVHDSGMLLTGMAITTVLLFTGVIFYFSSSLRKLVGQTAVQVLSTILGLITIAWGIAFIRTGLQIGGHSHLFLSH